MVIRSDFGSAEERRKALVVGRMSFVFEVWRRRVMSLLPMWPDAAVMKTVCILKAFGGLIV